MNKFILGCFFEWSKIVEWKVSWIFQSLGRFNQYVVVRTFLIWKGPSCFAWIFLLYVN